MYVKIIKNSPYGNLNKAGTVNEFKKKKTEKVMKFY